MKALPLSLLLALTLAGCAEPSGDPATDTLSRTFDSIAQAFAPPPDPDIARGDRLLAAGDPANAHAAYVRSIARNGPSPQALNGAGVAAARRGFLGEARARLEHALRLDPDAADVHNNLGAVLLALDEPDRARAHFASAIALNDNPGVVPVHNLALLDNRVPEQVADDPDAPRLERLGRQHYRLVDGAEEAPE